MATIELSGLHPAPPLASPLASIDARPALPVSAAGDSLWDLAASRRDDIATVIESCFEKRGIQAWVRKSQPGSYPMVVAVDAWMPVEQSDIAATVDKSALSITLSVAPFREAPLSYAVTLDRHAKHFSFEHWSLSDDELNELVTYLLDGGYKPAFFENRVPLLMRVIGSFIPFVGRAEENKLIVEARPLFWTVPTMIALGGLLAGALIALNVGESDEGTGQYLLAALVATAALIGARVLVSKRPVVQSIPRQPLRCPRREYRVDSWHVSVPGAGRDFDSFKQRIYRAAGAIDNAIDTDIERHQNATPRGFEERERLVLSKGQATLHIHVYAYGNDAFVGWDSHLNWNRWAEGALMSNRVKGRRSVEFKALDVGLHIPTEFDLIEADVLTETTHRRVVEEVKAFLKECEIEADLDFTIIRGDRSKALQEGKATKSTKDTKAKK